jgi:hypothetical protein
MNERNSVFVRGFAAATLIVILLTVMALPSDEDQEQTMESEALLEDAEKLIRARDRLGAQLDVLLADESTSVYVRIRAAQLLGRLQYSRAISTLIRNADLYPPEISELIAPPVAEALAEYGDAAVPQIVEACLDEDLFLISGGTKSGRSLFPLYHALRKGGTLQTARRYALGIAATRQEDAELVEKVETFVKRLERYERK